MSEIILSDDVDDLDIDLTDETERKLLANRMGSMAVHGGPCYWTLEDEDDRKPNISPYGREDAIDMMDRVLRKMASDKHLRSTQRGILENQRIWAHQAGFEGFETGFREVVKEYKENNIKQIAQWVL